MFLGIAVDLKMIFIPIQSTNRINLQNPINTALPGFVTGLDTYLCRQAFILLAFRREKQGEFTTKNINKSTKITSTRVLNEHKSSRDCVQNAG